MKRIISLLLTLSLCFFASSCKSNDRASDEAQEVCTVWESTSAVIDDVPVDFSENPMYMYLALFEDGIFQMSVSVNGTPLENYPQEGSYTFEDGIYTLETGWVGKVTDDEMELSYSDGEASLVFLCKKQD